MITKEFVFLDHVRNRSIPVIVYLPQDITGKINTIIYSPGYVEQGFFSEFEKGVRSWPYKNNTYLAKFFTESGYAFVSIQHDILGDKDGIETLDQKEIQAIVRKPLWERGVKNILFVAKELEKQNLDLNLEKFIIGGHSNGGDIAKYFANLYPDMVSHLIVCDGRRCPISHQANLKILMFEANDTSTDIGVIPNEGTEVNPRRTNLEWVIVKPKNALHKSYSDDGEDDEIKKQVCRTIDWFLNNY
jgi:hypothetical protein